MSHSGKDLDRPSYQDFPHRYPLATRWSDNDVYGHVNNVTYYSYFDTAVNQYLIESGGLDIQSGQQVGFVVDSHCLYHKPICFPDQLEVGLRVLNLGGSSVKYGLGIFKKGQELLHAHGYFVHVFVDRQSGKSVPIPEKIRSALAVLA